MISILQPYQNTPCITWDKGWTIIQYCPLLSVKGLVSSSTWSSWIHILYKNSFIVNLKVTGTMWFWTGSGIVWLFSTTSTPTLFLRYLHSSWDNSFWISSGDVGYFLAIFGTRVEMKLVCAVSRGGYSTKLTLKFLGGLRTEGLLYAIMIWL